MKTILEIAALIALLFIFGRPLIVLARWIYSLYDMYGMPVLVAEVKVHSWRNDPLVTHYGPHDFLLEGTIYSAIITIDGQQFIQEIPAELYDTCVMVRVSYKIGKSGTVYIQKMLSIDSCS